MHGTLEEASGDEAMDLVVSRSKALIANQNRTGTQESADRGDYRPES